MSDSSSIGVGGARRGRVRATALLVIAAAGMVGATIVLTRPAGGRPVALAIVSAAVAVVAGAAAVRALRSQERARNAAEQALRDSERKFAGILAIAVDAIITTNGHQEIVHFNRGAEQIFGWLEAEMLGKPLNVLIPERFRARHASHMTGFGDSSDAARHMGARGKISGLRKSGEEFPADASISNLRVAGETYYTVVLRDVTEQTREQRDEQFLARAIATLSVSLDYSPTLISVVHLAVPHLADCCVLDVLDPDGSARRVASVHEDPGHTRSLRALEQVRGPASASWPFPLARALATGEVQAGNDLQPGWEHEESPGGNQEEALASLGVRAYLTVPLAARDRPIGALTLLATDPRRHWDDRARALAERLASQAAFAIDNARLYQTAQHATRARDEILGVVSHDLRNPLSAIAMCGRVLHDAPPEDAASRREIAAAILESTGLMTRLIQDLLDVAMIEGGHLRIAPAAAALAPLIHRAIVMHEEAARERKIVMVTPENATLLGLIVDVDESRFLQVLSNLLDNALKFTESGGRITIGSSVNGAMVQLRVSDTGAGIPADHLPHIFDRYWHARRNARTSGTGLGLAIARGIVEAHGGQLTVASTLGEGTTFALSIPLAPQRSAGTRGIESSRPVSLPASVP